MNFILSLIGSLTLGLFIGTGFILAYTFYTKLKTKKEFKKSLKTGKKLSDLDKKIKM